MEKDPNMAKQFIMYSNDTVEATFVDGTKIFLASCATEYVVRQGNHTQGLMTTKHRTIYTTSTLLPRIRSILTFRNLYAQQPFLVPALVDSNQCYQSTGTATHVRWSPNISLPTISMDDPSQTWSWTSVCGRARIDIPQCRQIIYITHPLQVSRLVTQQDNDNTLDIPTKYIHVFAPIRRCFSCQKLPDYLSNFVNKCLQLIEHLSNNRNLSNMKFDENDEDWNFKLPSSLPSLSCPKAHRHRLHHEMMFEADLHILQTTTITYRLEYDNPTSIEALVTDENSQNLTDYIITSDIQSSFYNYYSINNKECQLLTLSEHALPPHDDRIIQIIRFMSNMRQRLLSMTRRIQERPCWMEEEEILLDNNMNDTMDQLKTSLLESEFDDEDNIFRQTSFIDVGYFKYFLDNHVQIKFSNGFILTMTPEQVHSCQINPYIDFQCRIIDTKKQATIDILDGITEPGCYEQYITAAIDWCMWVWNEKRLDDQRKLSNNIQEELFRLKLYQNMIEIKEYQQSTIVNTPKVNQVEYYSPDDIKQLLDRTAQFTKTNSS